VLAYIGLHFIYALLAFCKGVPLDSVIRRFEVYGDCLYFFLPIFFLRNKDQLHRVLLFVVFLSVLYPAWQFYTFAAASHGHHFITSSGTIRLTGSQPTPILACAVFALLIWKRGLSQYVLVSFPILALCLVGHRSVFLSLVFGLAFLFFFLRDIAKPILFAYLAGLSLILVFLFFNFATGHDFISDIFTRSSDIFSSSDHNTLARAYSIRDNFVVFMSHPLFGIGYDHECISRLLVTEEAVFNILHPHNFFMRHLSHTGIIGTLLIVLIISRLLSRSYTIARELGDNQYIAIFLFCSFIFFLMVSLMNTEFFSQGFIFWILGGTTVVLFEKVLRTEEVRDHIVENPFALSRLLATCEGHKNQTKIFIRLLDEKGITYSSRQNTAL
jgi:O-antigen ligase